ncbi:PX domain-containing protein 1-like [Chanos chanos]|uniref:PX domain-containing protein 1-like n=1 Tax=Chanos chanos TaxID=29144 RepID=A0A6J2VGP4_CHACN|nr:PX domain-containing protein 1-like [Chanos chanos]
MGKQNRGVGQRLEEEPAEEGAGSQAKKLTGRKEFCCTLCDSIQKKSLDLHSRRHHTGESFPCHLCQYCTPDRQLLLRHMHLESLTLADQYVRDCWVIGLDRLIVGQRGEEDDFFEVRTEWSDGSIVHLRRNYSDLVRLVKKLRDSFPEERENSTQSMLLEVLQKIKEAEHNSDLEARLDEVEKLLRNTIRMPPKYSQSAPVFTFFEACPLDQVMRTSYNPVQPSYQSPVTIAEIRRSNGFCLANTETIVYDASFNDDSVRTYPKPSTKQGYEKESLNDKAVRSVNGIKSSNGAKHLNSATEKFKAKESPDSIDYLQSYINNLTYLQFETYETDILE